MMKTWLAILAAGTLVSCQSIKSQHVDFGSNQMASGLHYAAPKAVMKVELIAANGALGLYISQPFLIGDPEATYVLNTSSSMFADNRYFFVVNPQTRLLTHVNVTSDGKAGKVLAALAKSVGAISGAGTKGGDEAGRLLDDPLANATLFSTFIDPFEFDKCDFGVSCELTALDAQLHSRAMVFLGCTDAKRGRANSEQCEELASRPDYFRITIDPLFKVVRRPVAASDVVKPASCSSSICYRAPAPYLIGVKVGDITDESRLIMMPNKSPVMAMDLPAGVFASAKARVDLVHGMPAAVGMSQESELLEIVAIPLDIIKGFFQGVGEVFSLRIQYDNSSVALLKAEEARQKAQDAYNDGQTARSAARLANAQSLMNAARTGRYNTDAEREKAMTEARTELEQAQADHNSSLAALNTALSTFPANPANPAATGDEAGTIAGFISTLPDTTNGDTDVAAAQKAQITTLDETQRMFSIKVIDNAAGGKARADAAAAARAAAAAPSASGQATLQQPGAPPMPTVDPAAANRETGHN